MRRKMRVRAYQDEMAFIADVTGIQRSRSIGGVSISLSGPSPSKPEEWRCFCGLSVPPHQKEVHIRYCEHYEQASVSRGDAPAGASFNALVKGNAAREEQKWKCYCGLSVPLRETEEHTRKCKLFRDVSNSLGDAAVKPPTSRDVWRCYCGVDMPTTEASAHTRQCEAFEEVSDRRLLNLVRRLPPKVVVGRVADIVRAVNGPLGGGGNSGPALSAARLEVLGGYPAPLDGGLMGPLDGLVSGGYLPLLPPPPPPSPLNPLSRYYARHRSAASPLLTLPCDRRCRGTWRDRGRRCECVGGGARGLATRNVQAAY